MTAYDMHDTLYNYYNHYNDKMNIIAITNQKGGVAKTTTAVNLSAALSRKGKRVLLVDLDPQANATTHMGIDRSSVNRSLDNLFYESGGSVRDTIIELNGVHVIPSGEPLAYAEQKLAGIPGRELILSELLAPLTSKYDYAIIDCPPNLGLLTINAFTAATNLIVTIKPEYFALEGLNQIRTILEFVKKRLNPDLKIFGYLIANYDARKNQHKGIRQSLYKTFNGDVFETVIRTNSKLSDCTSRGLTIFDYDPKGYGAIDYDNLSTEIEERYGR